MVPVSIGRRVAMEMRHARLGDRRLNNRLARTVEALAAHPGASVPEACGSWAAAKGAYRLWDSPRVRPEAIREAESLATVERVRGHEAILAIQDTTNVDVSGHPATKGTGPLDHPTARGLKAHSVLASTLEGVPLGILWQRIWTRDINDVGRSRRRRQHETREKESQRWITCLEEAQSAIPEATRVITVADREADIFDLLAAPRRPGSDLLIRAAHDRRVSGEARHLWKAVRDLPVAGTVTVSLRRRDSLAPREARLSVRYGVFAVHPPRNGRRDKRAGPVSVKVVLAEEVAADEASPICWLLYTTLPVEGPDQAAQCVRWYSRRWLIERYHYVLKSGCGVEKLQLREAERLERALATFSVVAWFLLWLTYRAREDPGGPCDAVLAPHEWKSLYCTVHGTPTPPARAPTLRDAVRWIARLGGFMGRKHDGEPGVKTIWRGLRRLEDIAHTWSILHPETAPQTSSTFVGNA